MCFWAAAARSYYMLYGQETWSVIWAWCPNILAINIQHLIVALKEPWRDELRAAQARRIPRSFDEFQLVNFLGGWPRERGACALRARPLYPKSSPRELMRPPARTIAVLEVSLHVCIRSPLRFAFVFVVIQHVMRALKAVGCHWVLAGHIIQRRYRRVD